MFHRIAAAVLCLAFAGAALADPRQDLHTAYLKMQALKSYKATMVDQGSRKTVSVVEFQAPDRLRMTMDGGMTTIVVGDTMYMTVNGRSMVVPMPKGTLSKYRNEESLREIEKGALVTNEGPSMVGGQPAQTYRFSTVSNGQPSSSLVWVSLTTGLVLQVETLSNKGNKAARMRILYSDFNSPAIRISKPN
jgi:outer membrane lipoprotein-sorting protein